MSQTLKQRMSLRELLKDENKKGDYLLALRKLLDADDSIENSFWNQASTHGLPDPIYCQHGTILFPVWHRQYMVEFEKALQSQLPNKVIAIPYWDQTSEENIEDGLPDIFFQEQVEIYAGTSDSQTISNPLYHYKLPKALDSSNDQYKKAQGYKTKRFPYSGVQYPEHKGLLAQKYNDKFSEEEAKNLLNQTLVTSMDKSDANSIYNEFKNCLDVADYDTFATGDASLEQPHNNIHDTVGAGFGGFSTDYPYASGDMAFVPIAGFDPIFFLHHANIDRMFWVWQKRYGYTSNFPTSLTQPLEPFKKDDRFVTGNDIADIHQYGFTYTQGSLDDWPEEKRKPVEMSYASVGKLEDTAKDLAASIKKRGHNKKLVVSFDLTDFCKIKEEWSNLEVIGEKGSNFQQKMRGVTHFAFENIKFERRNILSISNIDLDQYPGSINVVCYERKKDGKRQFLAQRYILSNPDRKKCKTCQENPIRAVTMIVPDSDKKEHVFDRDQFEIELQRFHLETGEMEIIKVDEKSSVIVKFFVKIYEL